MYSNLITDFEDMSCEMVYGQVPPPFEEDPVSKQPCYTEICKFDISSCSPVFNSIKQRFSYLTNTAITLQVL